MLNPSLKFIGVQQTKACRTLSTREANALAVGDQSPSASTDPTGQTPCPSLTRRDPLPPKAAARSRTGRKRPYKRRSRATRVTASAITCSKASRKLSKRKRWERTNTLDSDQSPQLPTNQLQCVTDDQPKALWKRWRQMEPRRGRRTLEYYRKLPNFPPNFAYFFRLIDFQPKPKTLNPKPLTP
jgi:hypothetical protein